MTTDFRSLVEGQGDDAFAVLRALWRLNSLLNSSHDPALRRIAVQVDRRAVEIAKESGINHSDFHSMFDQEWLDRRDQQAIARWKA